jgi:hypothetical protein
MPIHSGARLIEADSLLFQIIDNNRKADQNIGQFYSHLKVSVYDPEAISSLNEKTDGNPVHVEDFEKSFKQEFIFVRDELVLIETTDFGGELLNLLFQEIGGETYSVNTGSERVFEKFDLLFPYRLFFTKYISILKESLAIYGIAPIAVGIEHQGYRNVYRLGLDDENLLVDPDSFRVLELNTKVQIFGRYYPFKIVFSDWDSKKRRVPMKTKFYINSRLFKEIDVEYLRFSGVSIKKRRFFHKYKRYLPPRSTPFQFDVNFSK